MRTDRPAGLYVHIPFCVRKCNYCDFASFAPKGDFREKYIDALVSEIEGYKGRGIVLDTVFFGGGTPSLLEPYELEKIMRAVGSAFKISDGAEITAEINPATLTDEKLDTFLASGFNRFSIGLQSIHENELKKLGRIHNFQDFLDTYQMLLKRGIKNINIDLMFGIPEQTEKSFTETLDKAAELSPAHISVYGLIIEEGTPFYKARDVLNLPSEDEERKMYFSACETLRKAGYFHYEISNFAKKDCECRHNLKYWNLDDYIGVGLAAHSYFSGRHFSNPEKPEDYLSGKVQADEALTSEDEEFEYKMLKLRLADGLLLSEYKRRFDKDFLRDKHEKLKFYEGLGLLSFSNERIALTEKGFYVSNTILSDIL